MSGDRGIPDGRGPNAYQEQQGKHLPPLAGIPCYPCWHTLLPLLAHTAGMPFPWCGVSLLKIPISRLSCQLRHKTAPHPWQLFESCGSA